MKPPLLLTRTDIGIAAQTILNEALDEDQFESGGVGISIHHNPLYNR